MMGGGNTTSSDSGDSSFSSWSDESLESDSCGTITTDEDDSTTSSNSSISSATNESGEILMEIGASHRHDDVDDDCGYTCHGSNENDSEEQDSVYSSRVKDWTEKVPISLNLCPWAKLSHKDSRINYMTCREDVHTPEEASEVVWKEIHKLEKLSLPAWSTTLVICPHVNAWKNDYAAFEAFVKEFGTTKESSEALPNRDKKNESSSPPQAQDFVGGAAITLVPFHPHFLRWRGLPETISTGSRVRCHRGLAGFSKSPMAHPATVVDLFPKGFGRRRIRVRFDDTKSTEQCIPLDWVVLSKGEERPPLSDNLMHRAPYPVIHILRNEDLRGLSIHEISRLKRRNAKRMVSETLF